MSLIIKETDERYQNLEKIMKYSWDNIVLNEGNGIIHYFIPGELLISERVTAKVWLLKDPKSAPFDWKYTNYISAKRLGMILSENCNLNTQEFFDLVILHINDTNDRPKCCQCGIQVPWGGRFTYGYNQTYWWNEVTHTYCSNSHAKLYQATHPLEFPHQAEQIANWQSKGIEIDNLVKSAMTRFINKNTGKNCYFYLAYSRTDWYKFGIANDLDCRWSCSQMTDDPYVSLHCIYENSAEKVAYLEATLKLSRNGSEWIKSSSDFHKLIKEIKKLLKSDINNPFDSTSTTISKESTLK